MIACAVSHDLDRYLDAAASTDAGARFDNERVQAIAEKLEAKLIGNDDPAELAKLGADFMHHHDGAYYLAEAMKANAPEAFGRAVIAHIREVLATRAERAYERAVDHDKLFGDEA
jgi:hypothetical protein